MKFEWDETKNNANTRKHGVDFETALQVFEDPFCVELYDANHSLEEERYIAIGMVEDILFVVYTDRKDVIRLISARVATASERRQYYDRDIH